VPLQNHFAFFFFKLQSKTGCTLLLLLLVVLHVVVVMPWHTWTLPSMLYLCVFVWHCERERESESNSERERKRLSARVCERDTHRYTNTSAGKQSRMFKHCHTFHMKRSSRRSVTLRAFQFVSLSPLSARNSSHYNKAAATTKAHTIYYLHL